MYRTQRIATKVVFDMETGELLHWEGYDYCGPLDLCEGENNNGDGGTPDPAAGGGNELGGANEDYFLEVDDRTRYRTAEEAIQGYQQAGQRIAELTPWQQVATEYGLTDPQDVAALLDELAELRARSNADRQSDGRNAGGPTNQPVATASVNADPNSPEAKEAAAIKWLQEHGVQAGLGTKEQIDQVMEQLDTLRSEAEQAQDERFQQRIEYGHNIVVNELKTAGLYPTDPKDTAGIQAAENLAVLLEQAMTVWVNADDRRVKAFHQGGEALANLVRQGLQTQLPTINVLRHSSGANYAAGRSAAANRNQRTTAKPGSAPPARQGAQAPRTTATLKAEDGITPEVHERAWEIFNRVRGEQA